MKLIIYGKLPGLNDYTRANRTNRFEGAKMKADAEELITLYIKQQLRERINGKAFLHFRWGEPNIKRDPDNICFAKKFLLDALVRNNIIKSDGWKGVAGFTDEFFVDKENPRIEVIIEEA